MTSYADVHRWPVTARRGFLSDGEAERVRAHTEPSSRGRGRTIGIYGEFGIGNAGNDESARTLVALLRERGHHDIVAVTLDARRTVAELGIPAVQFTSPSLPSRFLPVRVAAKAAGKAGDLVRLIRIVRELGAVIVPGTGLLEAQRGRYPGGDIIWLGMLSVACRVTGVPLYWLAIGGGRFGSRIPARLCVWAARGATLRSYRDRLTRDALAAHGLDVSDDPVVSDIVLARPAVPAPVRDTWETVGVGPIDFPVDALDPTGGSYIDRLATMVAELTGRGLTVSLILGDEADARVAEDLRARVASLNPVGAPPTVTGGPGFASIVEAVSAVDVVVASRYHILVAALIAQVPVIALSHADKDDSLMAGIGLADWVFPITSFQSGVVVDRVGAARHQRPLFRSAMESARLAGADAIHRELDRILASLPPDEED